MDQPVFANARCTQSHSYVALEQGCNAITPAKLGQRARAEAPQLLHTLHIASCLHAKNAGGVSKPAAFSALLLFLFSQNLIISQTVIFWPVTTTTTKKLQQREHSGTVSHCSRRTSQRDFGSSGSGRTENKIARNKLKFCIF